jgi:AcrR family transcriptional regulator
VATETRTRLSVDARREQLLAAGAELLATRPPEQVSVADLAGAAGVSTGLLYHYFPSKRDFLLALTRSLLARSREATEFDPGDGAGSPARSAIQRFLDYISEHRTAFLALHAAAETDPELATLLAEARVLRVKQLLSARGAERPPSPALRAALAAWVVGAESLCVEWARGGELEREELERLLTELLRCAYSAGRKTASGPRRA